MCMRRVVHGSTTIFRIIGTCGSAQSRQWRTGKPPLRIPRDVRCILAACDEDMVLKRRRLQLPKPAPSRALPPLPDRLSAGRMSPLISLSAALPTNEACDEEEDLACKIADAVNAVATSEDWALVVHVCDRASTNERNAQVAVSALCQVFKHEHSDPLRQIGAARLWSIMLSNCSDIFIEQSNSLHFIHALEDLLTSSRTSVKVRECVIQALADAVSARGANVGFRMLWQRVKPLASSPIPSSSDLSFWDDESDDDSDAAVAPVVTHQDGAPPLSDEDVQWLFNECQTGVGNAKVLRQALATIAPELGNTTNIVGEYHKKCIDSHQIIFTQIPRVVGPERSQREEDLLSALLAANETLLETLKLYDDVKRGMKWIVCKVFAVTLPDELVVTMGEVLHVLSQYTDQWALCETARGELGMVPLECLLELRATE
ncbi:hypothetical protein B0H11DRAFT_497527 [Mycena galericulata]|nr:hypothetical protein B0H11DRAFT_497527 [Mycena galericulata]